MFAFQFIEIALQHVASVTSSIIYQRKYFSDLSQLISEVSGVDHHVVVRGGEGVGLVAKRRDKGHPF